MRNLVVVALLCSVVAAQECPLGSPKPIPKTGPVTPDGKRRTHKSCNLWEEITRLAPATVTPEPEKAKAALSELLNRRGKAAHTNALAEQAKLTKRMRDLDAAEKKLYELTPR